MSFILDALKKSERERSGVRAGEAVGDGEKANARSPWPLTIALVVASNALLAIGWWAWQRAVDKGDAKSSAQMEAPVMKVPTSAPPTTPIASSSATPVAASTALPLAKTSVGDLAAEARRASSDRRARNESARAPAMPPARAKSEPVLPALDDAAAQPVVARPTAASVPWLRELPSSFRAAVAPLNVSIHVFAGTDEASILYINDRQYRAGETLPNGVRLDAVVADGAVLSYQGQQFKLPRPN